MGSNTDSVAGWKDTGCMCLVIVAILLVVLAVLALGIQINITSTLSEITQEEIIAVTQALLPVVSVVVVLAMAFLLLGVYSLFRAVRLSIEK